MLYRNGEFHNGSGPIKVNSFAADGLDAKRNILFMIDGINADEVVGYLNMQAIYANGRRQSAVKSFLIPAKNRKNLHVIKIIMRTE